jgi:hypothetical protein
MQRILIIVLILIILFYIINNYILKKNNKEHYLTYFLPFYDDSKTELTNFYNNNENNTNFFKNKINYYNLTFGSVKSDSYFIKSFLSEYMAKNMTLQSSSILYSDKIKCIDDLAKGKINFCLNDSITTTYYSDDLKQDINNLRLVTNLYKIYIYIFTLKRYNIFTLDKIPTNFKIGIIETNSFVLYYKKFFYDIGAYEENIDYQIKIYKNMKELFDKLGNGDCNMVILYDVFPNAELYNILDNGMLNDLILLPFKIPNEALFLKRNYFINIETIDLNKISKSFLPKKFGNNEYTRFRPELRICYVYKTMITNLNTKSEYTYDFIKFYYENYKYINNHLDEGYKIDIMQIKSYLEYHKGILDFYKDYGYITYENNDNCRYLAGVMKCDEENLIKNNLT